MGVFDWVRRRLGSGASGALPSAAAVGDVSGAEAMSKWRIIMHWTAGADGVIDVEKDSYHFIVSRDGAITPGLDRIEDNIPPLKPGKYAAHTLNCNSWAIGVSLDAMAGAKESPFDAGKFPITEKQLDAFCSLIAMLATQYDVPIARDRILTHAEVEPTLKIKQKNKWDITWLPGMKKAGDPIKVGDELRRRIKEAAR